jgi:hypothetical protein
MNAPAPGSVTPERLMQFAWGYAPTLILEAAIRNRVFDVLDGHPMTLDEVSKATGASTRGLSAVMNALVGLAFLAKDANGSYSLTPESEAFLVSTKPSFQGGLLRHASSQLIPSWLNLTQIVATGKPGNSVNQEGAGSEFFKEFVVDILPLSFPAGQVLAKSLNLDSTPARVLDLAAGSGVWGIALAQSSPQVRVSAVDWPNVIPTTKATVARFNLSSQFSFIEGDLLTADFGSGYNVATLGHILHSEGEERSRQLLNKVFDSLVPGGTIAIAEFLVDADRTGPVNGLLFAVNMLVATDNGDTFSFGEISSWLTEAGFINPRTLPAPGPSPLVLATKP